MSIDKLRVLYGFSCYFLHSFLRKQGLLAQVGQSVCAFHTKGHGFKSHKAH